MLLLSFYSDTPDGYSTTSPAMVLTLKALARKGRIDLWTVGVRTHARLKPRYERPQL